MWNRIRLTTPLAEEVVENLRIGQRVSLNGIIYTGRDAAHKVVVRFLERGNDLPFLKGQIIYYVGPTPPKPGKVIGSAGPTTGGRMDAYAVRLLAVGVKGMIGHGRRSPEVIKAMQQYKAVYFAAVGGAAALISRCIKSCRVVALPELGTEAIHELVVEDFPLIVANDTLGGDLFEEGIKIYSCN